MKKWVASLSLGKQRRSPARTQTRPDPMEAAQPQQSTGFNPDGRPLADPQSSTRVEDDGHEGFSTSYPAERDENIIWNPCFDNGLNNWSGRGCKISLHENLGDGKRHPLTGKFFASTTDRRATWNGIQQEITDRLQRKVSYEVTAIVRTLRNTSAADLRVTLWVQAPSGREQYIGIAKTEASDEEWVQLQGKFLLSSSFAKAVIFFEGPAMGTDILVNSLVVKRMKKPLRMPPPDTENVLYGFNIIRNSDLKDGLSHWRPLGSCTLTIRSRDSHSQINSSDARYILTTNRTETWMGPSQTVTDNLQPRITYQVTAWVRVGSGAHGPQDINITFHVDNQWIQAGKIQVVDDRWYALSGFFSIEKKPSKAVAYVQGPSPGVDFMLSGLQIFPVDRKARFEHLKDKTDKVRKCDIVLKFRTGSGNICGASLQVRQIQNSFPLGSCFTRSDMDNEDFVDFFLKNFNWAVFGNELKWYHTESQQGKYNYKDADEMLDFCERHNIQCRGHCIFWEVEDTVQQWIKSLDKDNLMRAVDNRLRALLSRYKGKFRHYDVNNEMLHGSFYQDRLGHDIRAYMFREAHAIDSTAILFVNDYNVEDGCDPMSTPEMYIHQILDLQDRGAPVGGIGLQGHIGKPVGEVTCAALDKLAILGLPIWFTELDVVDENEYVRADDLEVVLREAYAHPAVGGVMLWGFFEPSMWRPNSHLVDADGCINEAGKRLLSLKQEWLSHADGHVDAHGEFKFRGYEGVYTVEINSSGKSRSQTFIVDKGVSPRVLILSI